MNRNLILILMLLLSLSSLISAEVSPFPELEEGDVKVALVLSGGGARGFAHIPIIKALEEAHIPIDMVVGTSMGAFVGGIYASGYSPDEMVELVEAYDMRELFAVAPVSHQSPELSVFTEYKNNIISLEFDEEGIGSAPGLIGDQKILELLNDSLIKTSAISEFDDLPIPFRAVGTDLATGEKIIFSKGSLIAAIRGSISIPGIFAPAPVDGRMVVDGGIVDNLPIQIALDMGADIIIAVDVNSSDYQREVSEYDSIPEVFEQLVIILTRNTIVDQVQKAHLIFSPLLGSFGMMDFTSYREIMAIGEETAAEQQDAIDILSSFIASVNSPEPSSSERRSYQSLEDIRIYKVTHTAVNPDIHRVDTFPLESFEDLEGEVLDSATLENLKKDLEELRESDRYATVTYQVEDIFWDADGKPYGVLDIITRDFLPRHLTLSLGLFGSTGIRLVPDTEPVFDFDPNFSVELNAEEFLHENLAFNFSIVQEEAVSIDLALRYHVSPAFSVGMDQRYERGYLAAGETVVPGTNDGEDYNYSPSLSAYMTYKNNIEVKLTAALDSYWFIQDDGSYSYRSVPSLSLGGVYTTQNFSMFPKQGTRMDIWGNISYYDQSFGYRFDFRGLRTLKIAENDYLTFHGSAGSGRSVTHLREDYFSYGGYGGVVTLSPALRVKERILASVTYRHEHEVSAFPLIFTARIRAGMRGQSIEELYAGASPPVIDSFDFFSSPVYDAAFSAGLGVKIQNADILFGVALDARLNTAFFVEVR